MKILYVFIHDYKNLFDVGFHFDPSFKFNSLINYKDGHDSINGTIDSVTLTMTIGDTLPKDFWGEKINSLTAIIGGNGAGKSTAIEWILKMVVSGSGERNLNGIIVFQDSDNQVKFYASGCLHKRVQVLNETGLESNKPVESRSCPAMETVFYSGHFVPYTTFDVRTSELSGERNISDSACLLKDLQDYSNVDSAHLSNTIYAHYQAYYSQNTYRISRLLLDQSFCRHLMVYTYPRYINFTKNLSIRLAVQSPMYIHLSDDDKQKVIRVLNSETFNKFSFKDKSSQKNLPKSMALNEIFLMSLLTFCVEQNRIDVFQTIWLQWNNIDGDFLDSKDALFKLMNENIDYKTMRASNEFLLAFDSIVDVFTECCDFHVGLQIFYVDIFQVSEEKIKRIIDLLNYLSTSSIFLVGRFFDIYFSHNHFSVSTLSSGEFSLLNIVSRLYNQILENRKKGVAKLPKLIILDEAEIGFHPDWQRRYISLIIDCFNALLPIETKVQIIYTTHSPLSLSDVPRMCINLLERDESNGKVKCSNTEFETFGSNVFDIYKYFFSLTKGFVGEYAVRYINKLVRNIKDSKNQLSEKYIKDIEIIGDPYIKGYLLSLLKQNPQFELARLNARIAEIRKSIKDEEDRLG